MGLAIFWIILEGMYDEETKRGVSYASIVDMNDIESFTLEKYGLYAKMLDSSISEVTSKDGSTFSASGFYKEIKFDINHPSFIKMLSDINSSDDEKDETNSSKEVSNVRNENNEKSTVDNPKTGSKDVGVYVVLAIIYSFFAIVALSKFDLFKKL